MRGSIQNGFRAPSPQQQNFTATSTNFINGVPFEITTFRPDDPVAVALGAKPLDAEKSINASLGAVMRLGAVSLTVDAYRIDIDDRIILSENLTQTNVRNYIASQGFIGVGGGRFFINGVDTTTKGVDIVLSMPYNAGDAGKLDFTLAANFTDTEVTKTPTTAQLSGLNPAPVLFDRLNVLSLEKGQPKNKISANVNWKLGQWGATLRATRYGEVLSPGTTAAFDFEMGAKTTVDLEGRLAVTPKLTLALGADNVFDQYPETLPPSLNTTGNTPFSNVRAVRSFGPLYLRPRHLRVLSLAFQHLAQPAGEEVHQRRHPRRQCTLLVEHGPHGLRPRQGVLFQHRHQPPRRDIVARQEIRQRYDARTMQRQLPQRLATRRHHLRRDRPAFAAVMAQRPGIQQRRRREAQRAMHRQCRRVTRRAMAFEIRG